MDHQWETFVNQGEKNFFAFLDKLDHLEAKKILIVGGK